MMDVASYGSMDQRRGLGLGLSQEQRQRQRQGQEQSPTYAYGEDDGGYLNDDYNFSSSILGGDDDYDGYVPGGVPINWILPQSDDATGYVIMSTNLGDPPVLVGGYIHSYLHPLPLYPSNVTDSLFQPSVLLRFQQQKQQPRCHCCCHQQQHHGYSVVLEVVSRGCAGPSIGFLAYFGPASGTNLNPSA